MTVKEEAPCLACVTMALPSSEPEERPVKLIPPRVAGVLVVRLPGGDACLTVPPSALRPLRCLAVCGWVRFDFAVFGFFAKAIGKNFFPVADARTQIIKVSQSVVPWPACRPVLLPSSMC